MGRGVSILVKTLEKKKRLSMMAKRLSKKSTRFESRKKGMVFQGGRMGKSQKSGSASSNKGKLAGQ